jgi:hypothetical protein
MGGHTPPLNLLTRFRKIHAVVVIARYGEAPSCWNKYLLALCRVGANVKALVNQETDCHAPVWCKKG